MNDSQPFDVVPFLKAGSIVAPGAGIISDNSGGIIGIDGAGALPFHPAQSAPASR